MSKKKRKKAGLPPGSVVFTGKRKVEKINIHYLQYNEFEIKEANLDNQSISSFHAPVDQFVQWYDLRGLHDTALIEEIGKVFNVHPLALEDIADTHQRPKLDEYDGGVFISLKALSFLSDTKEVKTEQVSLYFGKSFLLSFQEDETDLFLKVRERLQLGNGRIRKRQADYLAYALLDMVVDHYYIVLDELEETIENIEADLLIDPDESIKGKIHQLRQELLRVRKYIGPLREVASKFENLENDLIDENIYPYISDLRDHIIQSVDALDNYRDILNGLQDLYLSELSFKMNNVMQVLTVIATIFIPLTFLAGLYGMNFAYMPELHWRYSYFVLLGIMVAIGFFMLRYFKRKNWF
ncbi:MAG: magnesium/cobalt transporter CorA [Saprospiraceae bacterium]